MRLIALRGATTVQDNEAAPILAATEELMHELLERNGLDAEDLVSCIFTLTEDLDAEFPAVAARNMGLSKVPLLCAREIPVPGSLPRVIRVMIHAYAPEGARAPARLPRRGAGAAARPRGRAVSGMAALTDRRLAAALPEPQPPRVADLGCGDGRTLRRRCASGSGPSVELIGVERREPELEPALAGDPRCATVVADLNKPLPFEDAQPRRARSATTRSRRCSPPTPSSAEVARVLVPGGHFLLGHTDLDTIVFSSSELDLTRRLVHAFADTQEEWMDAADGTIGRKLPAIARRSPLEHVETMAWVELDTDLAAGEPADTAIRGITDAVRRDQHHELASQLEAWVDDLRVRAARGEFLFSVNDYAVLLRARVGLQTAWSIEFSERIRRIPVYPGRRRLRARGPGRAAGLQRVALPAAARGRRGGRRGARRAPTATRTRPTRRCAARCRTATACPPTGSRSATAPATSCSPPARRCSSRARSSSTRGRRSPSTRTSPRPRARGRSRCRSTTTHRHDLDAMATEITGATRLVIVCNPNNPTSTALPLAEIADVRRAASRATSP